MVNIAYATQVTAQPISQIKVENGIGYFDLVLNKNANGLAIRIADKFNENRVHVTLDSVDELIQALNLIKTQGVNKSVSEVVYDTRD